VTKKPAKRRNKPKADVVDDVLVTSVEDQIPDAEVVDTPEPDEAATETQSTEPSYAAETSADPEPLPVVADPAPEPTRGASPVWMLLGGLVAGGIGYGIATYQGGFDSSGIQGEISSQTEKLDALQAQIDELPAPVAPVEVDLSGIETSIADLATQTTDNLTQIGTDIAGLSERLDAVEKQPSADGTLQEAAVLAYQRDIDALRAQIEAQQSEMSDMITAQQAEMSEMMTATTAQLTQTREEAVAIEQSAIAKAQAAAARVALAKVDSAIDTGVPFGDALTELAETTGADVPDALSAAADGVPTLATLQAEFPAAARAALSAARSEGASGEDDGGFGSFLRSQLNVRSVAPQEGDSADAILSRAEAALKEGRLADTMAEVAGLPETARAALTDWSAMAETRFAAQEAAAELISNIDVN